MNVESYIIYIMSGV